MVGTVSGSETANFARRCVTACAAILAAFSIQPPLAAQTLTHIGVKAGGGISDVRGDDRDSSVRLGLAASAGGFLSCRLKNGIIFQPELLLAVKSLRREYDMLIPHGNITFKESDRLWYLEAPLLVKFPFSAPPRSSPSVYAGPILTMKLAGTANGNYSAAGNPRVSSGSYSGAISNVRTFSLGIAFGGDIAFPVSTSRLLIIDLRYSAGLTRAFTDIGDYGGSTSTEPAVVEPYTGSGLNVKNGTFVLSVGLAWAR